MKKFSSSLTTNHLPLIYSGYSGHADQEQLVNYVVWIGKDDYDPGQTTVFLNHGTDEARRQLKEAIEEKDRTQNREKPISVRLPEINQWYNLNKDGEREESGQDVVEETDSTLISEDTMITVSF
ncbi:MBL fold metallo-hydrolase RNA specificity domain-containing protein, partial [Breznakiellaceae bacterium SP9]